MTARESQDDALIHRGLVGVYFDETRITDIPGRHGELRYRGYSVDRMAMHADYETTCYVLLHGGWPTAEQGQVFSADLATRRPVSERSMALLDTLKSASPDVALRTAVSCLAAERREDKAPLEVGLDLVAKIPSLIAIHHDLRIGRDVSEPDPGVKHATDFLRRLLGRPLSALERRTINMDFVLHADHGANASAFAARVIASTQADLFGAVTGAIAALAGPLHGGAVAAAATMLDEIESPDGVPAFVAARRQKGLPIYGFGHRVYRRRDPRAEQYRQAASELCEAADDNRTMPVLDALIGAMAPYRRMGIDANYDLYAAVVYRLLGLPNDLASVVFAAGRIVGWIAQILEQQHNNILIRPRLRYAGPEPRELPNPPETPATTMGLSRPGSR